MPLVTTTFKMGLTDYRIVDRDSIIDPFHVPPKPRYIIEKADYDAMNELAWHEVMETDAVWDYLIEQAADKIVMERLRGTDGQV